MNTQAPPRGRLRSLVVFLAAIVAALCGSVGAANAQPSPATNPDLAKQCGTKVILVLDESGSIQTTTGAEANVRAAAKAFAAGLADTGSQLGVIEFGSSAKQVFGYTTVTTANLATTFNPYFDATAASGDVYDAPSQLGQWTNWEDAMKKVQALNTSGGTAPLVVFITDGDPTAYNTATGVVTNASNTGPALTNAITAANAVKGQGSHILAVGVGAALNNSSSLARLSMISGPDVVPPGTFDIQTTDVLAVADFSNLPATLRSIVNSLCGSSVTVKKEINTLNPDSWANAGAGWSFTGDVTSGLSSWTQPTGSGTGPRTGTTDATSTTTFQWVPSTSNGSSFTLTENANPTGFADYAIDSVTCFKKDANGAFTIQVSPTGTGSSRSMSVGSTDIILCTVRNKKVANPSLSVTKSTTTPVVVSGTNVTWSVVVTNNGNVPLTGVTLADPNATCLPTNLGNIAVGAGTTVSCTSTNVTAGFTNTATATGHYGTQTIERSGTADVKVAKIGITKVATTPIVAVGGTVTWTITVTNTGEVPLTSVTVTDAIAPGCATTIGAMPVGDVQSYTCTSTITDQTTNSATASGSVTGGPTVTATDTAVANTKGLSIQKTVNGGETATVLSGATVTWNLAVTNTGSVTLTGVTIADANASTCNGLTIASLASGATQNLTCQSTITADVTNSATATGTDPNGGSTTSPPDTASVNMVGPGVSITKSVDKPVVLPGTTVTWTITVTNTGDVPLAGVAVTDAIAPGCAKTIGAMPVGDVQTSTCTSVIDADTTNVAIVTATEPQTGTPVTPPGPGEATVTVVHPGISITKSVDKPLVTPGTTVTWTVTARNTGDVALTNVTVSDPAAPGCAATIESLAAGASHQITCSAVIQVDTTNVATVTATEPQTGTPVTPPGPGEATVKVMHPGVSIAKSVDKASVSAGTTVTYTITVKNTGDVALTGVQASDITLPACSRNVGDLAVGATVTYTCTGVITQTTVNTIAVTGNDPNGNPVTPGTASATVTVVPASGPPVVIAGTPKTTLRVDKSGPAKATVGKNVTYRIKVTNTGTSQAENVVVTDVIPKGLSVAKKPSNATVVRGSIQWQLGTIQPGATVTLTIVMKAGGVKAVTRCNTAVAAGSNADQATDAQCTAFAKVAGVKRPPKVTG